MGGGGVMGREVTTEIGWVAREATRLLSEGGTAAQWAEYWHRKADLLDALGQHDLAEQARAHLGAA